MTTSLSSYPKFRAMVVNQATGDLKPAVGYLLYTYQAGTTTPQATYVDSTGTSPNTNPVVLNANGEADVWLGSNQTYKFVLKDLSGVVIWTVDNYANPDTQLLSLSAQIYGDFASTANGKGDALLGVLAPVAGAVALTQHQKNAQMLTMKDFPCNADGVTDDALNILTAVTATSSLIFTAGTYFIGSNLTIPPSCSIRMEPGAMFLVAPNATLTINGKITAGRHQIFSIGAPVAGKTMPTITGYGLLQLEAAWFGAVADGNINNTPYIGTDNLAAFQLAIQTATNSHNQTGAGASIHAPGGAYLLRPVAFTASINSSNQLVVTAVSNGMITCPMPVYGLNITLPYRLFTTSQVSGTPGGPGVYNLAVGIGSLPGAVASQSCQGGSITLPNAISLFGDGIWSTILFSSTDCNSGLVQFQYAPGSGGDPASLHDMAILGNSGVGFNIYARGVYADLNAIFAHHLWINSWYDGLLTNGGDNWFDAVTCELCAGQSGIHISGSSVSFSNIVTYESKSGILVDNAGGNDVSEFPICITNYRSENDDIWGLNITNGKNVQVTNCSFNATSNSYYAYEAVNVYGSQSRNISINNATARVQGSNSTAAVGFYVGPGVGNDIEFVDCRAIGWLDGMKLDGGNVRVQGGYFGYNMRHGINANSWTGSTLVVNGPECSCNGQNYQAGATINSASFTGQVLVGNLSQLVVTAVTGTVATGQEVRGANQASGAPILPYGTYITGQVSGTPGGAGTYSLSQAAAGAVSAQAMSSVVCGFTGTITGPYGHIMIGNLTATQGTGQPQTMGVFLACSVGSSYARIHDSILAYNGANLVTGGTQSANITNTGIIS
jgi:hypothetical protein